ncbi:uncharacterized protein CBL_02609 [Carabus blaptoides fortunei]
MKFALLFLCLVAGSQAFSVHYDGYKVFRVVPENEQQQRVLHMLEKSEKFDFWMESRMANHPADIMVEPSMIDNFKAVMKLNKIKYSVYIEDVEKFVQQSTHDVNLSRDGRVSFTQYNRYDTVVAYMKNLANTHPDTNRMWRKTRSQGKICVGVDPNRNFDFHWNEVGTSDDECSDIYSGPKAFSEAETSALRDFALNNQGKFQLYLTFHSYGEWLLYPWGWTSALPENVDELDSLAHDVNDAIRAVRGTNYVIGSSTNVLYPAAGGSDDYMMAVAGIPLSYTVELPGRGGGFSPPASEIKGVVEETFEGVKVYGQYIANKYRTL